MKRGIWPRLLIFLTSLPLPAVAADLTIDHWRGMEALRLTGPIEPGTSVALAEAIGDDTPAAHGLPILLLDSLGGSVSEAMEISSLMERHPVHTVVPDGSSCASACASIVFIGGHYRTVEAFGRLGQHSCSLDGAPDQACNEMISTNAVSHGVSHGSVAAFVTYTAPDDILFFSREDADGWGLTRYPGSEASGFGKSEPRYWLFATGEKPPAQTAWRLDFREDGFRAFLNR